jgi:hypothetical protein
VVLEGTRRRCGTVDGRRACDLVLVDHLLRLRLQLRRRGMDVVLGEVDQPLQELLDLVGVTDWLEAGDATPAPSAAGWAGADGLLDARREAELLEVLGAQEVVVADDPPTCHFDHLDGPRLP